MNSKNEILSDKEMQEILSEIAKGEVKKYGEGETSQEIAPSPKERLEAIKMLQSMKNRTKNK